MRFRFLAVVTVLGLIGCTPDPAGQIDRESCPADRLDLPTGIASSIEGTAESMSISRDEIREAGRLPSFDSGMRIPAYRIFLAASWVDEYPACFTDLMRVRLEALRQLAISSPNVNGAVLYEYEYEDLLAALREP